jgi:hypothetical protein
MPDDSYPDFLFFPSVPAGKCWSYLQTVHEHFLLFHFYCIVPNPIWCLTQWKHDNNKAYNKNFSITGRKNWHCQYFNVKYVKKSYKTRICFWHFHHNEQFLVSCNYFQQLFFMNCNCRFVSQAIYSWQSIKIPLNHAPHFSLVWDWKEFKSHSNLWQKTLANGCIISNYVSMR